MFLELWEHEMRSNPQHLNIERKKEMKRASGILLPIFSLPSKYGIGCFSKDAYKFVDMLKEAGQSYWQILRLDRLVTGIPRTSLSPRSREIRILSI